MELRVPQAGANCKVVRMTAEFAQCRVVMWDDNMRGFCVNNNP